MNLMEMIYPRRLVFGPGCLAKMAEDLAGLGFKRLFILTIPSLLPKIDGTLNVLKSSGVSVRYNDHISSEPNLSDFKNTLSDAHTYCADCVIGIGGGSVMDVAKLLAAMLYSDQKIASVIGNNRIMTRKTYLICVPTTSGTGSEVSPNSIMIDDSGEKKGIISGYLVPDAAYVDPELTIGLPAYVTAFTGMDALTHCIEAFANRNAQPITDHLALEGIRLLGKYLLRAVKNGTDLEARSKVALGSLYGGMCLGPVNTAAVHALAYPLGSDFKIAHGISNALLLPYVMEYNLSEAASRYAEIALALGAEPGTTHRETALKGISMVRNLIKECNLPVSLEDVKVPLSAIEGLAKSAIQIQRLLKNNVKELTMEDILYIYKTAYIDSDAKA